MLHTHWVDSYRGLLGQVGTIAMACAGALAVIHVVGRRLIDRSTRRPDAFREALYRAAHVPSLALIVLCGAYLIGKLVSRRTHAALLSRVMDPSLHVGIIAVVAWAVWNLLKVYPRVRRAHPHDLDPMIYDMLGKFARLALLVLAALLIMRALHFPLASLLTVGGVAGIAIGFAAQGVVSNLFGAFVVYLDKPFKLGEWIVLPEMNISGTVEHIGWRSTVLRGFDTSPLYVPNYVFNSHIVETPPRMQARRIQQTLPVRYSDIERLPAILEDLRAYLANDPRIDHSQSEFVNFTNYGAHSLDILIYCFASTVQWGESLAIQEDVLLNAAQIIRRHGAQLALPVTRVQVQRADSDEDTSGRGAAVRA